MVPSRTNNHLHRVTENGKIVVFLTHSFGQNTLKAVCKDMELKSKKKKKNSVNECLQCQQVIVQPFEITLIFEGIMSV